MSNAPVKNCLLLLLAIALLLPAAAWAQSETVVYYHTDATGSVRATSDENGNVLDRYDYLPFGELCGAACGALPTPDARQYAGKERDTDTHLDYFGARYFRAESGRFTSVDPALEIQRALLDPQLWNRYSYVTNNPFLYQDRDGRQREYLDQDLKALMTKQITPEEFDARIRARAAGALIGAALAAGPVAWAIAEGCYLSASCQAGVLDSIEGLTGGPTVSGNLSKLRQSEIESGKRLANSLRQSLSVSEHVGADFVTSAGKTIDIMGRPSAYKFWDQSQFFDAIKNHTLKSVDYIGIDLTGASRGQIDSIRSYVNSLPTDVQARIIFF